ncbi:hypothetical protein NPIL_571561 [Nephila pilipes]|uniref:Uncharacterized protein n=1 Tax=Nephila pilipes TaxID=299642 RepID=A0A8X6PKL8_NEPPI|nr:hypothetical protein NPIL_571561 [Nephila pilipes]
MIGLSEGENDLYIIEERASTSAAVVTIAVVVALIGCAICRKRRSRPNLKILILDNEDQTTPKKEDSLESFHFMQEPVDNGEGHRESIYENLVKVQHRNQESILEKVEEKQYSPMHKIQFTFTEPLETETIYENIQGYRIKLVDKDEEDGSHFYDQPKSMKTKI